MSVHRHPGTDRSVIPWQEMEKELQRRLAEKAARKRASLASADEIEPPPDSGVRPSSSMRAEATPMRPLTYSMYTISELDEIRPRQMSLAHASVPPPPPKADWAELAKAIYGVARGFVVWVLAKPRPVLMDECREPLESFKTHIARLPWKRIATWAGIAFGSLFLVIGIILAIAEVTDDVKPRTRGHARAAAANALTATPATATPTSSSALPRPEVKAAAPSAPAVAAPPASAEEPPIEIGDTPTPASKKKPAKSKKKPAEIFIP